MVKLSISEFSEKVNLHPNTVRRWERIGLIKPVRRTWCGFRIFSEKDIEAVKKIKGK